MSEWKHLVLENPPSKLSVVHVQSQEKGGTGIAAGADWMFEKDRNVLSVNLQRVGQRVSPSTWQKQKSVIYKSSAPQSYISCVCLNLPAQASSPLSDWRSHLLSLFSTFLHPDTSSVASSPATHHTAEECDGGGGQRRHDLLHRRRRATAGHLLETSQRWADLCGRRQGRACQKTHLPLYLLTMSSSVNMQMCCFSNAKVRCLVYTNPIPIKMATLC